MKTTKLFIIAVVFTLGFSSCVKDNDDYRIIQFAVDSTTFCFRLNNFNEVEVSHPTNSFGFYTGCLSIPESFFYNDKKYYVVGIGKEAFSYCSELYCVNIPNMVTFIREEAFKGCENLTTIEIPNSVTSIGNGAFMNCENLTTIEISNSVTHLHDDVFRGCGFISFDVPNSISSIEGYAFSSCEKLVSVTIPETVSSINSTAFRDCLSLEAINVDAENAYYSSEDGVLFGRHKHELMVYPAGKTGAYMVPDGVTAIGEWAFMRCEGLSSITLPNTVASIGSNAFFECVNLTSLTCLADTPPVIEKSQLYGYFREIKVPVSSIEAYKSADGWKEYANIIVGI